MVLMTVEAFEPILLLTMGDHATDNEIVPVTIVRTIFGTMDNGAGVRLLCTGRFEARSAYPYTLMLNVVWPPRGVA